MKKAVKKIKLQIRAGKASPIPPIGPALGAAGLNIMVFCKEFNSRTAKRGNDDLLPVEIEVKPDKSFTFIIKEPPVAQLILKYLKKEKGSKVPNRDKIGELSESALKEIIAIKRRDMRVYSDEAAMRVVAGSARSMGVDCRIGHEEKKKKKKKKKN